MDYGKIIKETRIRQGVSQKELAQAAGVTTRTIIYWESEKRKINLEAADKIFKTLHMRMKIEEVTEND